MDFNEGKRSAKGENLEVTGVSRSGRVRKKSSKLLDFESSDEVDNKHKPKKLFTEPSPKSEKQRHKLPKATKVKAEEEEVDDQNMYDQYAGNPPMPLSGEESENEEGDDDFELDTDENADQDEEDDDFEGNLVVDEKTQSTTQSLYMMEKSNKKKIVIKDGKPVPVRCSRKDKGKTRFTAYMMWAKEVRQALNKQFPDMDFSTMARRLSEMWATVPYAEREHWRRKAKREGLKKTKVKQDAPLMPSRKFINKKGGPIAPLHNSPAQKLSQTQPHKAVQPINESSNKVVRKSVEATPAPSPASGWSSNATYRVTGIAPIDVAAHLKLLGESLSVIGERLQEHEGQIAVSGSLSVLLDSLLCSMGALTCLTQQVEELQPATNPETLAKILNNTAYIMPGLG